MFKITNKKLYKKTKIPNIVSDDNFILYEIYHFYVKISDIDIFEINEAFAS
jgi:hypothetical protein